MASKSKKRSKRRITVSSSDSARRAFQRGDYRQALKDARVAYRQEATDDHRSLLEHTYMGRIQQLIQSKQFDDATRIVEQLQNLGVTELSVKEALPDVLLALGRLDELLENDESGIDLDVVRIKAADLAVLRPESAPRGMPEIRDGAAQVRRALDGVENNDPAALGHLSELARQSPFADWKFFVRGLDAYYRQDKGLMLANWDRLDPDRAAAKIAAPLRAMAGDIAMLRDPQWKTRIGRLEKQVTGHALLGQLNRLKKEVADGDWQRAKRTLRLLRSDLRKFDVAISHRLVTWIVGLLVEKSRIDELTELARIIDPPTLDPHLHRARAVASHRSEDDEDELAESYWRKYLHDLAKTSALSPDDRDLSCAIVWRKIAEWSVAEAHGLRTCSCGQDHEFDIAEAESRALDALGRCWSLAPRYVPAYETAIAMHCKAQREGDAVRITQRLLQHVPDNLDALLYLARHFSANEPSTAQRYAEQARRLKPLDETIRQLLLKIHVSAVRLFACEGQFQQARDEMAAAERLQKGADEDFDLLACRAVLEQRSGDEAAAKQALEQAMERPVDVAGFWLAMAAQAVEYGLPASEMLQYEQRCQVALKGRCRSETAGTMARVLGVPEIEERDTRRRGDHVRIVVKYLGRCSRVQWTVDDLVHACKFLIVVDEIKLSKKSIRRGVKLFPKESFFHLMLGLAEIAKNPARINKKRILARFQMALELAADSDHPVDDEMLELAQGAVTFLEAGDE